MIKALIVDDEEWIRLGLRAQIHWESLGIEIVADAANGVIAMQLVEKYVPEIVLLDIRMPIMDGIQLMSAIHDQYPDILIIVVSGYSDFEYARKAISFHAFDYILKPIEEEKLEATLLRAVQRLREEQINKGNLLKLKMKINETGRIAREKFLSQVMKGTDFSSEEMKHIAATHGLRLEWSRMIVIVFKLANFTEIAAAKYLKDLDLAGFVVFNIMNELVQDYDNSILFRNYYKQDELVMIKGFDSEDYSQMVEEIHAKIEYMIRVVREFVSFEFYVGIGREFMNIEQAASSYNQGVEAAQNAGIVEGDRIASFDSLDNRSDFSIYPEDKERAFIYYLENSYKSQALALIEDFFNDISASRSVHPQNIRNMALELTMNIKKVLKQYHCSLEELLHEPHIHQQIMNELFTISDVKKWLKEAVSKAVDFIMGIKKLGIRKTINEIVDYLNKHYGEDINLNSVADKFFVNPAYLSRIFKSETSFNFNEYLNKVRMEAAAKLLTQENLKMNDISEMSGYRSLSYFLKKFKEHFGCTPTEYKRNQL